MNCIDAIEGTVKRIIDRLYQDRTENRLDDSEYIRNIKAAITGAHDFVQANPEVTQDPGTLQDVLFRHAKDLWRKGQEAAPGGPDPDAPPDEEDGEEYLDYYYDYLYAHGTYPL